MVVTQPASSQWPDSSARHIGDEETFWEADSLVVLGAEDKIFRARLSVMCQSPVFCRIIARLHPASANISKEYGGKLVVQLTDKAAELQIFLKALHQYGLYYKSSESGLLSSKAAILRLSTKYGIPHLRERTIKELSLYFPSTLAGYDVAQDMDITDQDFDMLALVVEETNARILLPVIGYMQCKRLPISPSYPKNVLPVLTSAIPTLIIRQVEIKHVVASSNCDDLRVVPCQGYTNHCNAFREKCFVDSLDDTERLLDPLYKIPMYWDMAIPEKLCNPCTSESRIFFENRRGRLWDELPSLFGLPSWEILRKESSTA